MFLSRQHRALNRLSIRSRTSAMSAAVRALASAARLAAARRLQYRRIHERVTEQFPTVALWLAGSAYCDNICASIARVCTGTAVTLVDDPVPNSAASSLRRRLRGPLEVGSDFIDARDRIPDYFHLALEFLRSRRPSFGKQPITPATRLVVQFPRQSETFFEGPQ